MSASKTASQITISALAPAKLNLSFDIVSLRQDGYHDVITLFQSIDLTDELIFKFSPGENNFSLSLHKASLIDPVTFPLDKNNSIMQAIKLFLAELNNSSDLNIEIEIKKRIPIGAGLAGGSTDAAATLIALNEYFHKPFSQEKLCELSSRIGSDVTFCLMGGLAIGRGRGEKLQKVDLSLNNYFILVKPKQISVSTPWAYQLFDKITQFNYSNTEEVEKRINNLIHSLNVAPHSVPRPIFWNSFEPVIFRELSLLAQIKKNLLELGCLEVHLTGSGPTIYGLVKDKEQGEHILKRILDSTWKKEIILDGWLAKSINWGASIATHNY